MLSDVTWRKMPTDMLTNETMTYIESQMPAGFEYAPFMFYQAALKKQMMMALLILKMASCLLA